MIEEKEVGKRLKYIIIKSMIIIFLVLFFISFYFIVCDFLEYKDNEQSNQRLNEEVIKENQITQEYTIDWEYLSLINKDIIGWIEIENTNINYPIIKDNTLFYLKHDYNKKYNSNGSIFTTNQNPFINEETNIYGHNMKNGRMFSNLDKYLNKDFFYSHLNLKIYTPTQNYKGTIFSAYSIGVEIENKNIEQLSMNERIEYYKKASKYSIENIDDITKIIKLSTCSYINTKVRPTNQRYYIIASIIPI